MENDIGKLEKTGWKKLDLINKMATLRNGNVPLPLVVLKGSKEDTDSAMEKEEKILGEYYAEAEPGNEQAKPGKVYFVAECGYREGGIPFPTARHEEIDVTGFSGSGWKKLKEALMLEGLKENDLASMDRKHLERLERDFDKVVTKVLYRHYAEYDDNLFRDSDLDAIKELLGYQEAREEHGREPEGASAWGATPGSDVSASAPSIRDSHPDAASGEKAKEAGSGSRDASPGKEGTDPPRPETQQSRKPRRLTSIANRGMKTGGIRMPLKAYPDSQAGAIKDPAPEEDLKDEDGEFIPKPTDTGKKKPEYQVKEHLTENEAARNEKLLDEIKEKYLSTIKFTEETCNSQYRVIINQMQESVDKNDYRHQFCPMYLELSDDTSSELYHRLYDLDKATLSFQKGVIHQIRKIGCPFCNHEWVEDITFFTKGPHFVKCPKCMAEQGFEKQ